MSRRGVVRGVLMVLGFILLLLLVWEGAKALGGDPWRFQDGSGAEVVYRPPFDWPVTSDRALPHVWTIWNALSSPVQRQQTQTLGEFLFGAALYTGREALLGFLAGAVLGVALAAIFVHSKTAERAFVPYVVASQTIPIIALAPMIVFAFGANVTSVVMIATYLTFFPVTIAMIRGLRTFDPRAMELMRSYAASRSQIYWKLRIPASLPFLFVALKIAATASIVGAIIGEGPCGINDGLGLVILTFNQYYITGPEKLWAAIIASGLLGIVFYLLVSVAEHFALRGRARLTLG